MNASVRALIDEFNVHGYEGAGSNRAGEREGVVIVFLSMAGY